MSSDGVIGVSEAILDDDRAYLLDLIRLRFAALRLQVDNLGHAVLEKDRMAAASRAPRESRAIEDMAEVIEVEVGVRSSFENPGDGFLDPAHRKVSSADIENLSLHKLIFNEKGIARVGEFSSLYHEKHLTTPDFK